MTLIIIFIICLIVNSISCGYLIGRLHQRHLDKKKRCNKINIMKMDPKEADKNIMNMIKNW